MARPAGVVLESGKAVANEPWRITGKVNADARHALFEQVEAQYGPDERRLRLGGTGEFGSARSRSLRACSPRGRSISIAHWRLPTLPTGCRSPCWQALWMCSAMPDVRPSRSALGIGIDTVTLGGASVQSLRADIKSVDGAWSVDTFEFRAPGATQVQFSGRLGGAQNAGAITGPLSIDSADPGVLMAWLEGVDRPRDKLGALRLRSDVDVGRERVAFERVSAEVDRKAFEGRFAYTYPDCKSARQTRRRAQRCRVRYRSGLFVRENSDGGLEARTAGRSLTRGRSRTHVVCGRHRDRRESDLAL